MTTVDLPGWFYNIGPGRPDAQVAREIRAMLAHRERPGDPRVAELRLAEVIGYHPLPKVAGYTLFADRSTEARANIATYIRNDLAGTHRWIDLAETWPRTDHPGTHPPRSFLVTRVGLCSGVTAHQGPPTTRRTHPAVQREGQLALRRALLPTPPVDSTPAVKARALARPRWLSYDANARRGDPDPSPSTLADSIGGMVAGHRIDCLVYRGCTVRETEYVERVRHGDDVIELLTDHGHAFRYVITVDRRWIDTPKEQP